MSPEDRPRPQYGEYASDSEWASAIERSGAARPEGRPAPPAPRAPLAQAAPITPVGPLLRADRTSRTPAKSADRVATIFLMSFGLVYFIGGASSYLGLAASIERMFGQMGVGDYTPTMLTPIIGIIIVVSQGVIWLIAAGWSYARIHRGRLSWWIPVTAGIVSLLATVTLLGVLLSTDPAFLAFAANA